MNLAELVVSASLLAISSSGASMQLMDLAAAGEHRRDARAEMLHHIDGQFLVAARASGQLASMPHSSCERVAAALRDTIEPSPSLKVYAEPSA